MIKQSLIAGAVLAACCTAAQAADVQIYGVIDTSLVFESVDSGSGRQNTTYMSSGEEWGSRWGIRGSEDLGNGVTVGFDLQSGIKSDSGELQYNRLFARESSLYVKGGFGKIAFGRMDGLIGLRGQTGKLKMLSAFGDGYGPYMPSVNNVMQEPSYIDNSVFYETPTFGGVTVRAQYGMGGVSFNQTAHALTSATENKSSADRYLAMTVSYTGGPLNLFAGVDSVRYNAETIWNDKVNYRHTDDSLSVTAGANYDFGAFRLYAAGQYFDEVDNGSIRKFVTGLNALKGYGASVSADIPAAGGNLMVAFSWLDGEAADSDKTNQGTDVQRLIAGVGYQYPLSKRTHLYGVVSGGRDKVERTASTARTNYYKAVAGLRHVF